MKIDIPKILLELRADVHNAEAVSQKGRLERLAFQAFAWLVRHPRVYEIAARMAAAFSSSEEGVWLRRVPWFLNAGPIRAWLSQRDLPPPPSRTFRQLWRER